MLKQTSTRMLTRTRQGYIAETHGLVDALTKKQERLHMAIATGLRCVKLESDSMTQSRTVDDCPALCSVWNTCEEAEGRGRLVSASWGRSWGPGARLGTPPQPLTWYTTVAMSCGYGCWLDRNSPMTLFMTSWGGKKSSRNWGRTRATTRASQGNPFRILCGGGWSPDQSPSAVLPSPGAPDPAGILK